MFTIFLLRFNVTMTSQSDAPIFSLFKAQKWSVMNSSRQKHELFDQLWEFYWPHVDFGAQTLTLDLKEVTLTSK